MITLPPLSKKITGSAAKLPAQSVQMLVQTLRQRGQSDLGDSLEQLNQYVDALGNMVQEIRAYLQQLTTTQSGITLANEAANLVFAGPGSGGAAAPAFRTLGTNDLPNIATAHTVPLGPRTGGGTTGSITFDAKGRYLSSVDPT